MGISYQVYGLLFAASQLLSCANGADWAFGIFIRNKDMLLHGTHTHTAVSGVVAFATSFLERTDNARLALLVDEGTGASLSNLCAWDGSKRCTLLREADVLPLSGLPPSFTHPRSLLSPSRTSLFVRRWWLYVGMMRAVEEVLGDTQPGYGLLTDVRDVVWQGDVFKALRAMSVHAGIDSDSGGEEPLFFAVEPYNGTVRDETAFNTPCARQCFPPQVMERYGHMPLSCAGTTAGSWYALSSYIRAMQSHTLFCAGPGQQFHFSGMDQPMHMYLLYEAILGRHPMYAGAEHADMQWEKRYGRLFIPAALTTSYPLHPDRDREPAYARLHKVALETLGGETRAGKRVIPLPLYHNDGVICTLSLIPWSWFYTPGESGYGREADITAQGRHGGPVCALVHQYDRHVRLMKLMDVRYAGRDPAVGYADSTLNMTY